jgi:hypothetical protein
MHHRLRAAAMPSTLLALTAAALLYAACAEG